MIPRIVHTHFGMTSDFGDKQFSLVHLLSIKSILASIRPDELRLYYAHSSGGPAWEEALRLTTPVKITPPERIFGVKLRHPAHRTDVHRLFTLYDEGGISIDLDVICVSSFDDLLGNHFVMGREISLTGVRALCSAVMLSEPRAKFAEEWIKGYDPERSDWLGFRSRGRDRYWGEMSVEYPAHLSTKFPSDITVLDSDEFFPLLYDDTSLESFFTGNAPRSPVRTPKTRAVHLWESRSWARYLSQLSPETILDSQSEFSDVVRAAISDQGIVETMSRL